MEKLPLDTKRTSDIPDILPVNDSYVTLIKNQDGNIYDEAETNERHYDTPEGGKPPPLKPKPAQRLLNKQLSVRWSDADGKDLPKVHKPSQDEETTRI